MESIICAFFPLLRENNQICLLKLNSFAINQKHL